MTAFWRTIFAAPSLVIMGCASILIKPDAYDVSPMRPACEQKLFGSGLTVGPYTIRTWDELGKSAVKDIQTPRSAHDKQLSQLIKEFHACMHAAGVEWPAPPKLNSAARSP